MNQGGQPTKLPHSYTHGYIYIYIHISYYKDFPKITLKSFLNAIELQILVCQYSNRLITRFQAAEFNAISGVAINSNPKNLFHSGDERSKFSGNGDHRIGLNIHQEALGNTRNLIRDDKKDSDNTRDIKLFNYSYKREKGNATGSFRLIDKNTIGL